VDRSAGGVGRSTLFGVGVWIGPHAVLVLLTTQALVFLFATFGSISEFSEVGALVPVVIGVVLIPGLLTFRAAIFAVVDRRSDFAVDDFAIVAIVAIIAVVTIVTIITIITVIAVIAVITIVAIVALGTGGALGFSDEVAEDSHIVVATKVTRWESGDIVCVSPVRHNHAHVSSEFVRHTGEIVRARGLQNNLIAPLSKGSSDGVNGLIVLVTNELGEHIEAA